MTGPELGVLLVTCDRPLHLRRVLGDLGRQSLEPGRFEVLVADDGSEPPANEAEAGSLEVRFVRGPRRGPAAARNRALPHLRAPVTLLLNDDARLAPDLLETHLELHDARRGRPAAVMGAFEFPDELRADPFHRLVEDLGLIGTRCMGEGVALPPQYFWAGNLSLSTAELLAAGGFDEGFGEPKGEDVDLGYRLAHERGLPLVLSRRALAWHDHPHSLEQWWQRSEMVGRSMRRLAEKHGAARFWPGGERTAREPAQRRAVRGRTLAQAPLAREMMLWAGRLLAGPVPEASVALPGRARPFELPGEAELLLGVALSYATVFLQQRAFWAAGA